MNKKILIGSIIAVVILVLVSFTGVVGYQTTKSSTIARASPLFTIRSSRAIDEESKDLTCDYVGKGDNINLLIPDRNNERKLFIRIIEKIRRMNDREIKEFITIFNKYKNLKHNIEYEDMINKIVNRENNSNVFTLFTCIPFFICDGPTNVMTICEWYPNCIMIRLSMVISIILIGTAIFIDAILEEYTLHPCGKCGPYPETL